MAAAALAPAACHKKEDKGAAGPSAPPPAVVVAEATQATVPIYSEYVGRTEADSTVDIRARVEGFLESWVFEEGKPVKKDQVLYKIDPRKYEANVKACTARLARAKAEAELAANQVTVRQAEAELDQAKAEHAKTTQDVNRLTPLAAEQAVPQQDLDNAIAANEVARLHAEAKNAMLVNARLIEKAAIEASAAAVLLAEADLTNAQLDLSYCTIFSPMEGQIGKSQVSLGNLVGRSEPTLLATVSSLDPMRVQFSISEEEYLKFAKRAPAGAQPEFPPVELFLADNTKYPQEGKLLFGERAVGLTTGTLAVTALFPNPGKLLRPNLFTRVRFVIETLKDAVLIPQRSVMERQGAKFVYVVGDGNAVQVRSIVAGDRVGDRIVAREGVKAGERVIVEGQQKAVPGRPVSPTDKPISTEAGATRDANNTESQSRPR